MLRRQLNIPPRCPGYIINIYYNLGHYNFKKIGIRHESIFNYDDLLNVAHQKKYIEETDLYKLKNWRDNPEGWK